jgi:hypothetical protein
MEKRVRGIAVKATKNFLLKKYGEKNLKEFIKKLPKQVETFFFKTYFRKRFLSL